MPTTQTWNGSGGDGDWGNSANWSTGTLPSTLDGVVFNGGPAATLTPSSGSVNIASLSLNAASASLTIQGGLTVGGAHLNMVPNTISNQGTLIVDGGSLTAGQYVTSATGNVQLTNGGTYLWQGTGVSTQTIDMGDSINDTFAFTQQFGGTIQNFHSGQFISYSGGVNSVTVGNNAVTFNASNGQTYTINLTGNYDSSNLIVSGNSVYTTVAVCYASGTLIRTARGDVPVETLRVGDLAITASGVPQPIVWLGTRSMTFDHSSGQNYDNASPIRVQAGAFGHDLPYADLWLSPAHSVGLNLVEDIFIPAFCLTNGTSVRQMDVDQVTYWHVELENHDALIANGLAAESYFDCGNRDWFQSGTDVDPDQKPGNLETDYGRPVVMGGVVLDAVRAQLRKRAEKLGWVTTRDQDLHLLVNGKRIDGVITGNVAEFQIPAHAQNVKLMSNIFTPADHLVTGGDKRKLGVFINKLHFDGIRVNKEVAVDDPRLNAGFYPTEVAADGTAQRWTNGCLSLPESLWSRNERHLTVLRVSFTPIGPRWVLSEEAQQKAQANGALRSVA
ncbi:Hint domain-containing protein [Aquirhabdus sp.]|uniref:Hint domain-containing protein n=1 Tax=Aquirhabdus sp. TaxID=2824160 RepID=UPI00396CDBD2